MILDVEGGRMMLRSCMARMLRDERGQATVEAAFAVPVLMVLVLMLVQPGIIRYDRIVMEGAAAAGCRLLVGGRAVRFGGFLEGRYHDIDRGEAASPDRLRSGFDGCGQR